MVKDKLLAMIRDGQDLTRRQRLTLVLGLSLPAMLSQLSTVVENFVDTMMVGNIGAHASAAIGLVETSIWLLSGLSHSASTGFYVQVAHHIGANDFHGARNVFRQGIVTCLAFCLVLVAIGVGISPWLPQWLGGDPEVCHDATLYFAIFCLSIPLHQFCSLSGGVLRSTGHVLVPAMLQVLSCVLNIAFNYVMIYGYGLGVMGAAIGTCCAELVVSGIQMWYAVTVCPQLRLSQDKDGQYRPSRISMLKTLSIAGPLGIEHVVMCLAQIVSTMIVAPLGTVALAAHSIGISVESLCYMPGYGVADAGTTLTGQTIGARRPHLCRQFAQGSLLVGILGMSLLALVMYVTAPWVMQHMSSDPDVQSFAASILRIEAFAEPLYAASIVCYGILVGAGATMTSCTMNLASIWLVRIPLAWCLASTMGLTGVWIAMAIELCFRGILFLWYLKGDRWLKGYEQ